jgi:hypothetical protein
MKSSAAEALIKVSSSDRQVLLPSVGELCVLC